MRARGGRVRAEIVKTAEANGSPPPSRRRRKARAASPVDAGAGAVAATGEVAAAGRSGPVRETRRGRVVRRSINLDVPMRATG
jgi:hypothetical protein